MLRNLPLRLSIFVKGNDLGAFNIRVVSIFSHFLMVAN